MDTAKEFPITIRHKIPYLSEILLWGIGISFLIFLLFYAAMSPTKYSSDEMAVAYYILVIPDWLKNISAIALGSFIILVPFTTVQDFANQLC